ncbi:MAG: hypothetical protein PVI15_01325 [Chromatiales bacterium]|jgi:hypothetical protein
MTHVAERPPLLSIALLSGAALAYEVLLMRLFSIIQWHHFAYMIISLALLGFGASGSFLSLFQSRLLARYRGVYLGSIASFGISAALCFGLVQRLGFNAEEILWNWRQQLALVGTYLLLAIPFFFAALAIALTFSRYRERIGRVYAADLTGAGLGSLLVLGLLFVVFPMPALGWITAGAMAAALLGAWELRVCRPVICGALALLVVAAPVLVGRLDPAISPYKALSQVLQIPGTAITEQRSSPLGLISVLESTAVPLRHAPGLSLAARIEPPEQVAVFVDGDGMSVIVRGDADHGYLDQLGSALPYHLRDLERVLILGVGGGTDLAQARLFGVPRIVGVELNTQLLEPLRGEYAEFSGRLLEQPGLDVVIDEARGYAAATDERFDLIQLSLLDSFASSAAGLHALGESYLYTVESLETLLERLRPGGYLAITRWVRLPPRDMLKLFATAIDALTRRGVQEPGANLLLVRGWQTATLLIRNGAFTGREIAAARTFADARAFDMAWYPGMPKSEANRYNLLAEPYFYRAASALLGDKREAFVGDYKFKLEPATDDRPYFFNFFRWGVLPELIQLRGRGGLSLLEAGYLVLIATLVQAVVASLLLILLPVVLRRQAVGPGAVGRPRVLVYFTAIGLAYLFVEIVFIQRAVLVLHHPLYAAATTLAGFLIFSGLGSALSEPIARRLGPYRTLGVAAAALVLFAFLADSLLTGMVSSAAAWPLLSKALALLALIAPLAFFMGMPFPLALGSVAARQIELVPWAWAVNGCASVVSAVLATVLAIHFGFSAVLGVALVLYGVAVVSFPGVGRSPAAD